MNFEEKLMTLRKSKGWSQEDLANQIGVSRQTISKWESSQTTPEMNKLKELSKIFEISVDELINNEEKVEDNFKENVFTKINLRPTNILLIIVAVLLVIGVIIGIILYRKSKNAENVYIGDFVIITYDIIMEDKIEVTEIYAFSSSEECIGINKYIKTFNQTDYKYWRKEIIQNTSNNINPAYNIYFSENEIVWSSLTHKNKTKENIINERKSDLVNVQNLQIIDM